MRMLVADAAPLIFLAKLTLLELLCKCVSVAVPSEVVDEVTRRQELPDAVYIRSLIEERRIRVERVGAKRVAAFQGRWGLGRGESEALVLAQTKSVALLTDDYAAMRVAKALRLSFVTTPLVIVQLHAEGRIPVEVARAKLERLKDYAWLGEDVLAAARELLKGGGP